MKKLLFTAFFLLFGLSQSYSQTKRIIYADENYKQIDFTEYSNKMKSGLYFFASFENDTAVFKKLRFKEFYGSLNTHKKTQLNKLFYQRFQIDSTKIWLIHYIDSVPDIKRITNKSDLKKIYDIYQESGRKNFFDKKAIPSSDFYSVTMSFNNDSDKKYKDSIIINYDPVKNTFQRIINKEEVFYFLDYLQLYPQNTFKYLRNNKKNKYADNKNIALIHFYNLDKYNAAKEIDPNFFKDPNSVLKKTFSDGMLMYNNILIFPDGNFYSNSNFELPPHIFNEKKYKAYKKNWKKKYQKKG